MFQTIRPYRHDGGWIFDDPDKDVIHEPLVEGIDQMLELLCPEGHEQLTVDFNDRPFTDWRFRLDLVRPERGGGIYRWTDTGMEGWLCPCLLKYFEGLPASIYLRIREVTLP